MSEDDLPHANVLILIGQMFSIAAVIVVGLHCVCGCTEVVLGAAVRGQIVKIARILADLKSRRVNNTQNHWEMKTFEFSITMKTKISLVIRQQNATDAYFRIVTLIVELNVHRILENFLNIRNFFILFILENDILI